MSDISLSMSSRYIAGCHYDDASQRLCLVSGNYYGDMLMSLVNRNETQPAVKLLGGHNGGVRALAASGNRLYTAGEDSKLVCWQP